MPPTTLNSEEPVFFRVCSCATTFIAWGANHTLTGIFALCAPLFSQLHPVP